MPAIDFTNEMPRLAEYRARFEQSDLAHTSGLLVLLKAVEVGLIALTVITGHRTVWTPRTLKSSLPRIVVISDYDGNVTTRNPDEWRCAISAIAWSGTVIVHATAAQERHYAAAIFAAVRTGRCLMVETDSHHGPAWVAAVRPRRVPMIALVPFPGGVHPVKTPVVGAV